MCVRVRVRACVFTYVYVCVYIYIYSLLGLTPTGRGGDVHGGGSLERCPAATNEPL